MIRKDNVVGHIAQRHGHHGHKQPDIQAVFAVGEAAMQELMAFKASERKDDPARLQQIHGPYEEATLRKTGRLPNDYYVAGDGEPWGLRMRESRSNILWQVLSGVMDRYVEFGSEYMALALDHSLDQDNYSKELRKLNKSWGDFLDHAGAFRDHQHHAMTHDYTRVSCPACSTLTALTCQNPEMQKIFRNMVQMSVADRRQFLIEQGMMPLLDKMIPVIDKKPG